MSCENKPVFQIKIFAMFWFFFRGTIIVKITGLEIECLKNDPALERLVVLHRIFPFCVLDRTSSKVTITFAFYNLVETVMTQFMSRDTNLYYVIFVGLVPEILVPISLNTEGNSGFISSL